MTKSATQMNWKKPLALAVALIGLGSLAAWLEYSRRPRQEAQQEQQKKLFAIQGVSVSQISVSGTDGRRFVFRCLDMDQRLCKSGENSRWELTEPTRMRADDSNVNSLLSTVNNVASSDQISLTEETPEKRQALLRDYGLGNQERGARKVRRIELTGQGIPATTVWVGDLHPMGETLYAMIGQDENRVVLVPSYFKSSFEHDLTYWRDKKISLLKSADVEHFELKSAAGKSTILGDRKNGLWTLHIGKGKSQEDLPGDIESIDTVLGTATFLTAKQFVTEDKTDKRAKALLRGARLALTLNLVPEPSKGQPVTFQFFQKKGASRSLLVTTSGSDPLYEVDFAHLAQLDRPAKDLRLSKLITSMDRFNARKLEFSGTALGKESLTLKSDGIRWKVTQTGAEASSDKVQQLLDRLSGNRIRDFLKDRQIPAGEAQGLTVVLGDDQSPEKRKLVFWKSGSGVYARDLRSPRMEAFVLDPAVWEMLPAQRDHFKAPPKDNHEHSH